jgi:predicted ribosome quality control (RQC) complex YloA/Tae2 family protein
MTLQRPPEYYPFSICLIMASTQREESQNLLEKAKKRCKRKISELEKQLLQVEEKLKGLSST